MSAAPLAIDAGSRQAAAKQITNALEQALALAKQAGATAAEAGAELDEGLSVNVRQRDVETVELQRDRGLGVTVYFGQRKGSASTTDLTPDSIAEVIQAACAIARYTAEDDCSGLADAERMAQDRPDLDLDHPWAISTEQAIQLASECEAAALDYDAKITNTEGASLSTYRGVSGYANSHGFLGLKQTSRHSLSCSVLAGQGEHMQRDYWYDSARDASKLQTPSAIGREAAQRTLARLGAQKLSTRSCPVLFSPGVARGLIGHFIAAISGGSLYRKSSFLLDSAGTQVFSPQIQLLEQPRLVGGNASAAWDGEGVATAERQLVIDGVVQGYVLSSYSARKLGLETTGNAGGCRNLSLASTTGADAAGMLQQLGTGLLVTELMGQGVNSVTGDYSRGASGFWVENGLVQYPVQEITIAGNLKQMYRDIVAAGSDLDRRGNIVCGSILLESMTVAGTNA